MLLCRRHRRLLQEGGFTVRTADLLGGAGGTLVDAMPPTSRSVLMLR